MRTAILAVAALATLGACAGTVDTGAPRREELRLAELLKDRVPGEPRSCIPAMANDRLEILDRTAILYRSGETIWVARPDDPASLDTKDILVIERSGGQLCKQDVIRTIDRSQGFLTGIVFLGDWIPYRKR